MNGFQKIYEAISNTVAYENLQEFKNLLEKPRDKTESFKKTGIYQTN